MDPDAAIRRRAPAGRDASDFAGIALALTALALVAYAYVDWLWLDALPHEARATAGLVRTVAMSLTAVVVFAVYLLWRRERTDLSAARRDLFVEREKLRSILDCMADAVVYADVDGRIRLRNRAAAGLWGGRAPVTDDLRVCHDGATWQRLLARIASAGPEEAHPILHAGGRSFEATWARVSAADGRMQGVVMVARDVTERLAEQDARIRQEKLVVVGKLAASVAHEINNPLGVIALFAQNAVKRLAADDPLAEHLDAIVRNAKLCKKTVKDLLGYARQPLPTRARIAAADLLADAARTIRWHADRAHVAVDVDAGEDAVLHADADQIGQVLVNLGLNAVDAMPHGGRLALRARRDEGGIVIEVSDTGGGVAPEDEARVFDPFYTTKPEGTGLGLAVARDLVVAHGGSLALVNRPGVGATFVVALPVGPAAERAPAIPAGALA